MLMVRCKVSCAPVRRIPDHSGEMVTQLLFGEKAVVLDRKPGGWLRIKTVFDDYEGWVSELQTLSATSEMKYNKVLKAAVYIDQNGHKQWLPPGSEVNEEILLQLNPDSVTGSIQEQPVFFEILQTWFKSPYLWGGRTPAGVDCGGFTQILFKCMGISLPRDAYQQAGVGESVDFLQQAQPGDLAFFDNEEGRIYHVGVLLNDHEIVHAFGEVRIDTIDAEGILNRETGQRTHRLRIIKRNF